MAASLRYQKSQKNIYNIYIYISLYVLLFKFHIPLKSGFIQSVAAEGGFSAGLERSGALPSSSVSPLHLAGSGKSLRLPG